jgi:hypothetical protein
MEMNRNLMNVVVFLLLVAGLVSYVVETWRKDGPSEEPEAPAEAVEEWLDEERMEEEPEEPEPVDLEALRASIRDEILAELKKEAPATPVPDPTATPVPTPEPGEVAENPESEAKPAEAVKEPTPTAEPRPPGPDIEAMRAEVDALKERIASMRRRLQQEDRALAQEKTRILQWSRELRVKYEDDVFSVTKTRAEQRRIDAAVGNWRSRQRRQRIRREMLEEAEEELQWKQERMRRVSGQR